MSEDRGRIDWRMELEDYSMVLVALSRLDTEERILSYELPHLMMWDALLTELDSFGIYFTSYYFILLPATMWH